MDCGYLSAGVLVGVGAGCRACVGNGVLWSVGLGTGWHWGNMFEGMKNSIGVLGKEG